MSTSLLLAILLIGAVIVFACMCALLILVGSVLAVWRCGGVAVWRWIVKPRADA
jgi:hypothetical protein